MSIGSTSLRLAYGAFLSLGVSHAALAQSTMDGQPGGTAGQAAESPGTVPAEGSGEILVTGLRESIEAAIDTKRQSTNIVDSITAQDIGKLPDQNVVETLSRIPGVQITRFRGDGQFYTIRGISQNLTLINGRPFPTGLDAVSPDIVAAVDVIKTPSADMIEGALGGTVNLRTKRPLDLPSNTISARAALQYGEIIDELGFRGSALYSTRLSDRLGFLVNVAYQDIRSEQQQFETQGYTTVNNIDGNGDGVADPGLLRVQRFTLGSLPQRRERFTVNSALEFDATDNLRLLLEGTYNKYNSVGRPQRLQILVNTNSPAVGAVADSAKTVVAGRFNNVTYRPLTFYEEDENQVISLGGRAEYENGPWQVALDATYAEGKAPRADGSFTFVIQPRAGLTNDVTFDLTEGESPSFAVVSNFDLNDPTRYRVASISDPMNTTSSDAVAARFDVTRDLGFGLLDNLQLGYRFEEREQFSVQRRTSITTAELNAIFDTNKDGIIGLDEIPYQPALVTDFFSGVSGNFPRSFLGGRLDGNAARDALGSDLAPIQQETLSEVKETKHAFYGKLNLAGDLFGMGFRGNIGARYVTIDRQVDGFARTNTGTLLPVRVDAKFNKFLPSATLVFDLQQDLLLRLSAARVIATPNLTQLRSGFTFSIINNTGSGGNPLLAPFEADQVDASLEYYFGGGQNLLAASVFYKDVSSFTINQIFDTDPPAGYTNPNNAPLPLRITRPTNGTSGKVKGFEVNYQHALEFLPSFLSGLGYQLSYTYVDSSAPNSANRLPTLSTHNYSIVGYYDQGPLEARLAYTYRSKFLVAEQGASAGGNQFSGSIKSLDGSISFELTDAIKLSLDVQNILRDPIRIYNDNPTRVNLVEVEDRRFYLGVLTTF